MKSILEPLRRANLGVQIAGGFGILLILITVLSIISYRSLRDIETDVGVIETSSASLDALSSFFDTFSDARRLSDSYMKSPSAARLFAARSRQADVEHELVSLGPIIGDAEKDLRSKVQLFKADFEKTTLVIANLQSASSALGAQGARLSNFSATIAYQLAENDDPVVTVSQRLDAMIRGLLTAANRYMNTSSSADAEIVTVAADRVRNDVDVLRRESTASPSVLKLMDGAAVPIEKLLSTVASLQPTLELIDVDTTELTNIAKQIVTQIGELRKASHDRRDTSVANASETIDSILMRDLISAGLAVTLGVVIAILVGASISRLISGITTVMSRLAQGDTKVEVPMTDRTDAVGSMAKALQVFKAAATENLRLEEDARAAGRLTEAERAKNAAMLAEAAGQQTQVVESVAAGLSRLSAGDLVHRIEGVFPAEYERLRSDFNGAMARLNETLQTVSASATAIRSGTGEISAASDDLSRRTEQQAASLEQTAAALDEINVTVRKTAEGSKHARGLVATARGNAERSGEVVRQAIEAMSGIERSSQEIGQIISVIDEIAFQTNLLALNAGVEAARAGDGGRGFAVVASEVRALAQRSALAAKEIKGLISRSGTQVEQGVAFVGQAGQALSRIVAEVAEIDVIVGAIAASTQEQAAGLDEVNTAVNQMDQVTQQNAAMVEESTAASHTLSQEAAELARLIAGFRLEHGTIVPPQASIPALPLTRRRSSGPRPMLKTSGRGGAAPHAEASTWEEF